MFADKRQKSRGARELEVLGATPSNWRIFNVSGHLSGVRARGVRATLFRNRRLDDAIILKHALRSNERDLFERPKMIATKVLIPLDPAQITLGAISFFVGERSAPEVLQRALGIRHDPARGLFDPDIEILSQLDKTPSLDVFLLREILCNDAVGVSTDVFTLSLADDPHFRTFIYRELAPLVNFAIGTPDPAKVYRFVDSIFGASLGTQAADFLTALNLPQPQWAEIVFAWKAALFYEKSAPEMRRRFEKMAADLRALRTYGHNESYPRSLMSQQHRELADVASRAFARCLQNFGHFNSQRRAGIIARGNSAELTAYLAALPASVLEYGTGAALVDHILSYWAYCSRGYELDRFPAETFSIIASDICSMDTQYNGQKQDSVWS
jgi:hypothetical protein